MIQPARLSRRQRAAALVAAVAILGIVSSSAAMAEPVATVVQVTTFNPATSYSDCGSTAIANNSTSGVTLAAWSGSDYVGASAPLQVAVIGANGAAGAAATYQPDASHILGPQGWCDPLAVDAGPNGGFIVTWTDADNDNAAYGIIVNSAGAFVGGAFALSSNTNYGDIETITAAWSAADSRYLVTWKAGNVQAAFPTAVQSQEVVGRFIDGNGVGIGNDFLVTNVLGVNNSQDVAYGAGTWISVVAAGSTVVATPIAANGTVGASLPVPSPAGNSSGPSIEFNSITNQFLVVAKTNTTTWGQLLTSTGALSGAPFVISTGTNFGKPRLASLGADGWIVSWHTNNSADVVAIELSAAGVPIGAPEFLSAGLNDTNIAQNFRPEITFAPVTGQAYAIWSRYDADTNETNVVARAWAVTAAVPLPANPAVVNPALAATGVNDAQSLLLGAAAALALLVGAFALVTTRRRASV